MDDILITGADDFVAPYVYDAIRASVDSETKIWMLGTGSMAGIKADLASNSIQLPAAPDIVIHLDTTDGGLAPDIVPPASLIERAKNLVSSLAAPPRAMVYLSGTDVYGTPQGENIDEATPCRPCTPLGHAKLAVEQFLSSWCHGHGVSLAILRPAMTVGTGMGGELRRIVNRVWRGTYRHVSDNQARVSVVHATSLADAVVAVIGKSGTWNVTDADNPTRHDLVEALAWRLSHKRVYSLPLSKARLLARIGDWIPVTGFTTRSLDNELATLTYDTARLIAETDYRPASTVQYLKNHVYDESTR